MNSVVTTFVGYEHSRMCIVETTSVVVSVHCKCPATGLPCYGAIEVGESHILVVLPAVQDKAEVSIATIPPDAKHVAMTVQAFAKCLELTDVFCYAENVPSMIDGNNIPTDAFEGQKVGSAKVQSETTDVFTSLQTGEVGIVKIGSKSVKVVVR